MHHADCASCINTAVSKPFKLHSERRIVGVDIYEIRRINLRQIRLELGRGGQAKIADKLGTPIPHVSAMIGKNPTRNIGPILARRAEHEFKKDKGWMDQLHDQKKGNVLNFPGPRLSPEVVDIAKQIEGMQPEARDALRKLFSSNGHKTKSKAPHRRR